METGLPSGASSVVSGAIEIDVAVSVGSGI